MNETEFQAILDALSKYLAADKNFISNPFRETELRNALTSARELYPDAKIWLNEDPLQMGAMTLCIEHYDVGATGETEINLFSDIIKHADNFEIYALDNGNVRFAAVFQHVLIRV